MTPPDQPAMPPRGTGGVGGVGSEERGWRAAQIRMAAVHAAVRIHNTGAFPIGTSVLDTAADFEHYIITGEIEEPTT